MKLLTLIPTIFLLFVLSALSIAFADPSPSPSGLPPIVASLQAQAGAAAVDGGAFLGSILQFVQSHGGLGMSLMIACVCLLAIASMKVTILDNLIWNKLGKLQILLPPALGIVVGLILVHLNGPLTLAAVCTYAASGMGSVYLHELLDAAKVIPGLGAGYVSLISAVEGALGGTPSVASQPSAAASDSLPKA